VADRAHDPDDGADGIVRTGADPHALADGRILAPEPAASERGVHDCDGRAGRAVTRFKQTAL
jgi:hypothetical protein